MPDEIPANVLKPRAIDYAHRFFANAREIGEPGHIDMVQGAEVQSQHALMAQTAALVSIADSLDAISRVSLISARRVGVLAQAMDKLQKEITKIRYSVK